MTPKSPPAGRRVVAVSVLFVVAAIISAIGLVGLAVAIALDCIDDQPMPNRMTIAALVVAATALTALFCVGLRDSFTMHVQERVQATSTVLARIEGKLDEIISVLTAFRRQNDNGLVAIHDEVNRLAEGHTGELVRLTDAIKEWGDAQETRGELIGLRAAVDTVPGVVSAGMAPVVNLRSTS